MELPEAAKRQRSLASDGALSPVGANKKKKVNHVNPSQQSGLVAPPLQPKYTVKILTPLEPYIRCEDEWGEYMESPKRVPSSDEDMDSPKQGVCSEPDLEYMKSPKVEPIDRIQSPDTPVGHSMSDGPAIERYSGVLASVDIFPVRPPTDLQTPPEPLPEKQLCRTRQDRKFVECRYGDRCNFSHDCPRCPGLSHAAFHCPKPLFTIRILGPMVPTPRPSPGDTPAFDPLSPYNSSSFLMSSESHPCRESTNEPSDILDWDYGSMDNVPCEYLYGAWMQSPAHGPRPAPQDLLDEEDLILTSDDSFL